MRCALSRVVSCYMENWLRAGMLLLVTILLSSVLASWRPILSVRREILSHKSSVDETSERVSSRGGGPLSEIYRKRPKHSPVWWLHLRVFFLF